MVRFHLVISTLFAIMIVACGAQPAEVDQQPVDRPSEEAEPTATPTEQPSSTPEPSPTVTTVPVTPTSAAAPQTTGTPISLSTGASVGIGVLGSEAFSAQAARALDFLNSCAPEALQTADLYIEVIQESDRSGMLVGEGIFLASEVTAFAPGYTEMPQVFWFAGSIVHDAHHRAQSHQGMTQDWGAMTLEEREFIEADAREVQINALEMCADDLPSASQSEGDFMLKYLTDMQAGITECDYCKVEWENRNW